MTKRFVEADRFYVVHGHFYEGEGDLIPGAIALFTYICPNCDNTHIAMTMLDENGEPKFQFNAALEVSEAEEVAGLFLNPAIVSKDQITEE